MEYEIWLKSKQGELNLNLLKDCLVALEDNEILQYILMNFFKLTAQQKRDYSIAAGLQYEVGDKCHVSDVYQVRK